jgi:hypothetical protein
MPVTARSMVKVTGRLVAGILGQNPAEGKYVLLASIVFCVGSSLCDELITRSEEC